MDDVYRKCDVRAISENASKAEATRDFVWLHSSVETSFALWSCSIGSNSIYYGMSMVEKSVIDYIRIFKIVDKS